MGEGLPRVLGGRFVPSHRFHGFEHRIIKHEASVQHDRAAGGHSGGKLDFEGRAIAVCGLEERNGVAATFEVDGISRAAEF